MSEFLPVFVQNALEDNEELLPAVASARPGAEEVLRFCRNYRLAGVGSLLLTGESDGFLARLSQSARAFARFVALPAVAPPPLSRAAPFLDGVAAGDQEAALTIARGLRPAWARGEEYEEDYLFIEYLMQRFFLELDLAGRERLLARWEVALEGADDPRLPVCRALEAGDAPAFDAAFRLLLDERRAEMDELVELGALDPEGAAIEVHLDVTGAALARLARQAGLALEAEYSGVPSLVLEADGARFTADSWRRVGA